MLMMYLTESVALVFNGQLFNCLPSCLCAMFIIKPRRFWSNVREARLWKEPKGSLQGLSLTLAPGAQDVGSEGAAGDPQVMGVLLFVELVHVQVPEPQVSIGGAGHEHLATRSEGAGDHCGVVSCSGPSQTKPRAAASTCRLVKQRCSHC